MNSGDLTEVCKQIVDEATAIRAYADSIDALSDEATINIFSEIRQDELGHLQKLVVALTEMLSGEEPKIAEQMDEGGDDSNE